jgi:hypothetical protein
MASAKEGQMSISVWVLEYQTEPNGKWKVSKPYASKRIAEAKCADEEESPYKAKGWAHRVREYAPWAGEENKES